MIEITILTDVPLDEVDQVVEDFKSEGCIVDVTKQESGKYTVKATPVEKGQNIPLSKYS